VRLALSSQVETALETAREAGRIAMAYFRDGEHTTASIQTKLGGSPVSTADLEVNHFLERHLRACDTEAGWLSEESVDDLQRLSSARVFIIDPIDGTRAFIRGDRRWVISIAMIEYNQPIWGIIHAPALGETFVASYGQGSYCNDQPIIVSNHPQLSQSRISGPLPSVQAISNQGIDIKAEKKVPSLAYRFALVAQGKIEAGISSTNPCDWDIAAVDLILREAGGVLSDLSGKRPAYNKALPQHGVLVGASAHLHDELIARLGATNG
jgi:myo-inositol-1(or 4)-monophosphatase